MTNELTEKLQSETALVNLDGFDSFAGFTDEVEGGEQSHDQFAFVRVIQGVRIAYNNEAKWVDASNQLLPTNLQLIADGVLRLVQKWGHDNMPSEPAIILSPHQKWPDTDAMNNARPRTEWRMRFGELVGPYQKQKILYLWDPDTMNKYSWPTGSNSGMSCISDLIEKIMMMRQFKKVNAKPIVKLSSRLWSKRYNKQGPDLIVVKWVVQDATGAIMPIAEIPALAKPEDQFPGLKPVSPPTGKEATGDEILF
jgi:hypothetical protein